MMLKKSFGGFLCCLSIAYPLSASEPEVVTEKDQEADTTAISNEAEENGTKALVRDHASAVVLIHTISNSADDDGLIYNSAIKKRLKKHHYKHGVISGVVLSKEGIICTTYEGIMNADDIVVSIDSELNPRVDNNQLVIGKNEYKAAIIKSIPELNLAFLKIKPRNEGDTFSYIGLGNDAALINGEDRIMKNSAVVIGKAKGDDFVTQAKPANARNNFDMFASGIEKLIYKKVKGTPILLIDNAVTGSGVIPENEGGAIVDLSGKLVGLAWLNSNDFSYSTSTAIPVSVIRQGAKIAVPSLVMTANSSRIGVNVIDPKDFEVPRSIIKALSVSGKLKTFGAFVDSVDAGSVADNAEIQHGDIILKFNNDIVNDAEMYTNLENSSVGEQTVFLKILRGSNLIDLEINK